MPHTTQTAYLATCSFARAPRTPRTLLPCLLLSMALFAQAVAGVVLSLLALSLAYLFPALAASPPPPARAPPSSPPEASPRRQVLAARRMSADSILSTSSSEGPTTPPGPVAARTSPLPPDGVPSGARGRAKHLPTVLEASESRDASASKDRSYFSPPRSSSPAAPNVASPSSPIKELKNKRSFKLPRLKIAGSRPALTHARSMPFFSSSSTSSSSAPSSSLAAAVASAACPRRRYSSSLPSTSEPHQHQHQHEKKKPSRRAVARTDPYAAPFFFPSPVSPAADAYVAALRQERARMAAAGAPRPAAENAENAGAGKQRKHSLFGSGQKKRPSVVVVVPGEEGESLR